MLSLPDPKIVIVPSKFLPGVWGQAETCGADAVITLTKKATRLEKRLFEYVVMHEYAHVLLPGDGHGQDWKALMDKLMPDWRKRHHSLRWIEEGVWGEADSIYS